MESGKSGKSVTFDSESVNKFNATLVNRAEPSAPNLETLTTGNANNNIYQSITGAELFSMGVERVPCLFGEVIPAAALWALVGSSDTGKSMCLRQCMIDLVNGKNFLNFTNNAKHQKGIYVASEDDPTSTSYLLRKQCGSGDNLEKIRFHFDTDNIPEYLQIELQREPADLVIIDAWADIFGQNLNDTALIRTTLNQYRALALKYKCSICFLHHTGKRTEKLEPSKNNILSGQGFEAKMRLVIELRADLQNDNTRHFCIVKGNYLSREYKNASFSLYFNPENFRFSDTGERMPFEQLASPDTQSGGKKNTPFHHINEGVHRDLVAAVFRAQSQLKYRDTCQHLANYYAEKTGEIFGRERSEKLLAFLVEKTYITKSGKSGASLYEVKKE